MRKVDETTYEPVEQAESTEVTLSRPQKTPSLGAVAVVVAVAVLAWWLLSRNRS